MAAGRAGDRTPIELRIERANPRALKDRIVLPEPLADPLQDIRVEPRDGGAYS